MAKSTPSSGSRKSPACKSRPAKRAATPKDTSKPKPGIARQTFDPLDKATPETVRAPVPLLAEINIPSGEAKWAANG